MKKQILFSALTFVGLSMVATAAPIDCMAVTNLQQLINANGVGGCQHQDKIFSNFAYTGAVTAANVAATHEFSGATGSGLFDVHGWLFNASAVGGWSSTFTLSYNVNVDVANFPLQRIYASKDQQQSGFLPNATNIVDTQSAGSLHTFGNPGGNETMQISYANRTSLTTSSVFTCVGTTLPCNLQSYEQNWFETGVSAVPEPASFGLIGLGLVGLAAIRRRQQLK